MQINDVYFITDLDRTIIHAKNKGFKCVEHIGDREITYMTDESYDGFLELLSNNYFKFVPCTMRNIKQTLRVDFIKEYNPKYMICTNGAQIYIDGVLDNDWDLKMKSIIDTNEVIENIKYIESLNLDVAEVRNIEGFYITIKCENNDDAKFSYDVLKDKFKDNIKVIHIGVKIFIIDELINKINAVDYLVDKLKIEKLFTAGDSVVDEEFTKRGKAMLPKHSSFKHKNAYVSEKEGIHSTEDLVYFLKKEVSHCNLINN